MCDTFVGNAWHSCVIAMCDTFVGEIYLECDTFAGDFLA